ncbi:hypothetical protein SPPR111872_24850 [Sphingobacterium prati]
MKIMFYDIFWYYFDFIFWLFVHFLFIYGCFIVFVLSFSMNLFNI